MKYLLSSRLWFAAVSVMALTLTGCGTLRPLSSKPPLARITLSAPHTTSGWQGLVPPTPWSVILPPGEYRPMYEDDKLYYYQGPAKVVVNTPGSFLFDGGVYVARGTTTPGGWYYVDDQGAQVTGPFKAPLSFK